MFHPGRRDERARGILFDVFCELGCGKIPPHLREAIAGGIGIFLAFIGLRNSGLIVANPATLVGLGQLGMASVLFLVGLVVAISLQRKGKAYAFLVPAMINLIGEVPPLDQLEGREDVFLHVYGKSPRKGRKLGHVTVVAETREALEVKIEEVFAVVGDRSKSA